MLNIEVYDYGIVVRDGDLNALLEMKKPPEDNMELLRAVLMFVRNFHTTKAGALIASEIFKEISGTIKIREQEYDWGLIKDSTDQ